jgi:hypothetical protein
MSKRLSVEDRHAVDLLLERPDAHANKSLVEMVFARPVKGSFEKRLDAVEKILNVLSAMPAPEPPRNLVNKTLQRIERAQLEPTLAHRPKAPAQRGTSRHA